MMFLVDHNLQGHALLLSGSIASLGTFRYIVVTFPAHLLSKCLPYTINHTEAPLAQVFFHLACYQFEVHRRVIQPNV